MEELQAALDCGRLNAIEALCQLHRRLTHNSLSGFSPPSSSASDSLRAELPATSLHTFRQQLTRQSSNSTRRSEESRHTAGSSFVNVSHEPGTSDDTQIESQSGGSLDVVPRTSSVSSNSSQQPPGFRLTSDENNFSDEDATSSSMTATAARPPPLRLSHRRAPDQLNSATRQPGQRRRSDYSFQSEKRRHSEFSFISQDPHPGIRLDIPGSTSSSSASSQQSRELSPPVPPVQYMQPYLPSRENNFLGFCKGAWKLQENGVANLRKAFNLATRPTGFYRDRPYWKCCKCTYSGRVHGIEGRRLSWTCDPTWHVHSPTGIGYRWAFLAKSHIPRSRGAAISSVTPFLSSSPTSMISDQHNLIDDDEDSGIRGPFGCIFCCAMHHIDTPVYGTLDAFMLHLAQNHRMFPAGFGPVLEKMKCVIGRRVLNGDEDCEVNIPSI